MNPAYYRVRLLCDLFWTLLLPVLVLFLILSQTQYRLGFLSLPAHIAFIILWGTTRNLYRRSMQEREARLLGARLIPCVIGKWPGNIDVLLNMMRAFKSSYILDVYVQLFEEYQCTTINTRILWSDTVGIAYMISCLRESRAL